MKEEIREKKKYKYTCDYCDKPITDLSDVVTFGSFDDTCDFHTDCYNKIPQVLHDHMDTIVEAIYADSTGVKYALTLDSLYYILWEDSEDGESSIGKYDDKKSAIKDIQSEYECFPNKHIILALKNGKPIKCHIRTAVVFDDM